MVMLPSLPVLPTCANLLVHDEHACRPTPAPLQDPVVLVGCIFIMLNCACVVAVSLLHRQWLPAWSGWAMVGCYATYLTAVLTVLAFD